MRKVLATITTYNPEIDLFERNIDAVISQVDKLIVYENMSKNRETIVDICKKKGVEIILNDKNYGVAGPLHDGIEYAYENGYPYILTLDQDSVSSEGMVTSLLKKIIDDESLAIVGTLPVMTLDGVVVKYANSSRYVDSVITSGSLADVAKIRKIGGYIPEMFIDWVDMEICFRAITNGYRIELSNIPLIHCFGTPTRRRFLWKKCIVNNYSPFRCYYIVRNSYFCARIYKNIKKLLHNRKIQIFKSKLKILLFEKDKLKKLRAIHRGKKDSKKFYKEMINKYDFLTLQGANKQ